jgi:virulence-associated protein VapD
MTIDIQVPATTGHRWQTIADESKGNIANKTHGEEYTQGAVYFKRNDDGDLYMVAQISQEEFVEGA